MANARQMGQDLATRRQNAGSPPNGTSGTALATPGDDGEPIHVQIRKIIETQSIAFKAVLPAGVDTDRFARLVLNAIKATPELMACFGTVQGQTSILLAAMQAAAVGLEPNTPTQDCWLLPRKNKGVAEAQLRISYRGWLKLARRSGTVRSIDADVVHEKDHFVWKRSFDGDVLDHEVYDGDDDPGKITHAYARVFFHGGGYAYVVLNRRQINKRRMKSDSQSSSWSPWNTWEDEMARKTAIHALRPYLDLSSEVARVLESDDRPLRFNESTGAIDAVPILGELSAGDAASDEAGDDIPPDSTPPPEGQPPLGDDDPGRPFDAE